MAAWASKSNIFNTDAVRKKKLKFGLTDAKKFKKIRE
jgi:hypothetical protein